MLVLYSQTRRTSIHMVTYNDEMKKERDDKVDIRTKSFPSIEMKRSQNNRFLHQIQFPAIEV